MKRGFSNFIPIFIIVLALSLLTISFLDFSENTITGLHSFQTSATNVSACTAIAASGIYTMNESINAGVGTCMDVNSDDVVFDCNGFDIYSAGLTVGVAFNLDNTNNITIQNCNIRNISQAISMISTNNSFILDNNFTCIETGCSYGAYLLDANNNTFNNSDFLSGQNSSLFMTLADYNEFYYSVFKMYGNPPTIDSLTVYLNYSNNNYFYNSTADDSNAYGSFNWDSVAVYSYYSDNNTFNRSNIINSGANGGYGLVAYESSGNKYVSTDFSSYYNDIYLELCQNDLFSNITLTNTHSNSFSFFAYDIDNTILENFSINSYTGGIYLEAWNNPELVNNTIRDGIIDCNDISGSQGIYWYSVINSTLDNVVMNNLDGNALFFSWGCNNNNLTSISGITYDGYGFYMFDSDNNDVSYSNFSAETTEGIYMEDSDNNDFYDIETYSHDDDGIYIENSHNNVFDRLIAGGGPGYYHMIVANATINTTSVSTVSVDYQPGPVHRLPVSSDDSDSFDIAGGSGDANSIEVSNSYDVVFRNAKILPGVNWIYIDNFDDNYYINFSNTTFASRYGSINLKTNFTGHDLPATGGGGGGGASVSDFDITAYTVGLSDQIQLSNLSAFVNSTNMSVFNVSAHVIINYVTAFDNVMVDFTDSETYQNCTICENISYDPVEYTVAFDVPHWTTYKINGTAEDLCGMVLSSDYTLAKNFSIFADEACFSFGADDLTLNCNGHYIFGNEGLNRGGIGVNISGRSNITVTDCIINATEYGFYIYDSTDANVLNNVVKDMNVQAVYLGFSYNNSFVNNSFKGFAGLYTELSDFNEFNNSIFEAYGDRLGNGLTLYIDNSNNTYNNCTLYANTLSSYDSTPDPILPLANWPNWAEIVVKDAIFSNSITFRTPFSQVKYPEISLVAGTLYRPNDYSWFVDASVVSGFDVAFVNSSQFPELNHSANITFFDVSGTVSGVLWDPEDDGTYVSCPGSVCTALSQVGNVVTVEVQHWTHYTLETNGGGDNYNVSSCMNLTAQGQTYVMNTSFAATTGTCIRIQNSSITLDCNGFSLNGSGSSDVLVLVEGFDDVTLLDCNFFNSSSGAVFTASGTANNFKVLNTEFSSFNTALSVDPGVNGLFNNTNYSNSVVCLNVSGWNSSNVSFNNFNNCTTGLILNGSSNSNLIFNNSFVDCGIALSIENGTDNIVYYNNFTDSTVLQAFSVTGNQFNTSVAGVAQGNYWSDIISSGLDISDTSGDGFGDSGTQYPYSLANAGDVSANIEDYGPILAGYSPTPTPAPTGGSGGGGSNGYYLLPDVEEKVIPSAERPDFVAPVDDSFVESKYDEVVVEDVPQKFVEEPVYRAPVVEQQVLFEEKESSVFSLLAFLAILVIVCALVVYFVMSKHNGNKKPTKSVVKEKTKKVVPKSVVKSPVDNDVKKVLDDLRREDEVVSEVDDKIQELRKKYGL